MEPKKGRDEKTRRFASFIRLFITLLALSVFSAGAGIAEGADVKFLVTSGAGIRAFAKTGGEYLQTAHFVPFKEYALVKGPNEGGYDVYTGTVEGESFHYVAGGGGSGFLKTVKVVFLGANETRKDITIDVEELDPSHREDNGFKGDSVYFNVNDAQHLVLNVGENFDLIPIRVWQAMEGVTGNYFVEPDYKVEVLGESGVVSDDWSGSPGLEYAKITGLKPGVAVLRVTYGPIRFDYDAGKSEYYNAIDPINTGIVVVTVLEEGKDKDSSIKTEIQAREYDTIYFDRARTDHAEYTFKPSGPGEISVRVHSPIHDGTAWGSGWIDGTKTSDGSFTVKLYAGRNIVEVSASGADFNEYHVINAKGVGINIANLTDPDRDPRSELKAGDRLEISFDGIRTPVEKIAGIYNPGFPDTCYVKYDSPRGEVTSQGVQYNLLETNAVTVTVPESGVVSLRNGVINCDHMGDPLGSHRKRPGKEPVYPNFTAVNVKGEYSVMPDISLSGQPGGGTGTTIESPPAAGYPEEFADDKIETDVNAAGMESEGLESREELGDLASFVTTEAIGGAVTADAEKIAGIIGGNAQLSKAVDTEYDMLPLPVFEATVTEEGRTALVSFRVDLDATFHGKKLAGLAVVKLLNDGSAVTLTKAASLAEITSGEYFWTYDEGSEISDTETVSGEEAYYLHIAVGDGSLYDWNGEPGKVADPAAIAVKKETSSA
ncbi:MAG: hypothetical protein LBS75_04060, partial [Synergistaceae bacterium]|nr:hypothetical protein [Synergistaceae bacterium]